MVTLSGGNGGGMEADGSTWAIGDTLIVNGEVYRRIDEAQAVYIGPF